MPIGALFSPPVNPFYLGELEKKFAIHFGGINIGKGAFAVNMTRNAVDIVSPHTGAVPTDRFVTGNVVTITCTLQQVSEDLLQTLFPDIFEGDALGNMMMLNECSLDSDYYAPLKIYEILNCSDDYAPNVSSDPVWSFYKAKAMPTGDLFKNTGDALRAMPITFNLYALTQTVLTVVKNVIGYQGSHTTLGVIEIP